MNVRELNDEQAEQLGKTLEAWINWADYVDDERMVVNAVENAYGSTRKLQQMLQPPKQFLVQWEDNSFGLELWSLLEIQQCSGDDFKTLYEWRDGVGTVGEPITGDALKELLEGEPK